MVTVKSAWNYAWLPPPKSIVIVKFLVVLLYTSFISDIQFQSSFSMTYVIFGVNFGPFVEGIALLTWY